MPRRRVQQRYRQLTAFERGVIVGLRTAGWSYRAIARHVGHTDMTVARCWTQWEREGTHTRHAGSGRPPQTTPREDRRMVRAALQDPLSSAANIQAQVTDTLQHPVSSRTVDRRLAAAGLRVYRPMRRLPLTPHHRRLRLLWCRDREAWNDEEWRRIMFSDESRFCMSTDDHRVRVRRRRGQRTNPSNIVERHTGVTPGIMVWGAIGYGFRSPLVVIRGTLTAERYVTDILRPHVLPLLQQHPGTLFQQDNARPHTARRSMDCLRHADVLPWPARSPDLSIIEHVWDQLGRQLRPSANLGVLEAQLQQLWADLPQERIQRLYDSIPHRIAACLQARGGATPY